MGETVRISVAVHGNGHSTGHGLVNLRHRGHGTLWPHNGVRALAILELLCILFSCNIWFGVGVLTGGKRVTSLEFGIPNSHV